MLYTGSLQTKKDRPNYYIVVDYYINDKRKQKWLSTDIPVKGNNKRKADARLKEILAEYNSQGLYINAAKNVLFTEYLKQWLEDMKPSVEAVTYDTYKLIIHNQIVPFFEKYSLKIKDVTPIHIQRYTSFKLEKVSANTVRKHLFNLSKCFDKAVMDNIIAFNPVKRIEKPKKVKYMGAKFYNEKQIEGLLSAIKDDILETLILCTLFYGLRRSEVLGFRWSSVDFQMNTIIINQTVVRVDKTLHKQDSIKNKSSYRTFPMAAMVKEKLLELRDMQNEYKALQPNDYIDEDYVFTGIDGQVINPNYVTKHFKDLLIKHNLPLIRFHDLRHSSASFLLYLGFNLKQIQVWLGHGEIGTTMNVYGHLDISAKEEIANTLNEKFENFNLASSES
jgi:integrase